MQKRRIMALVLSVGMVVSAILGGCGQQQTATKESSQTSQTTSSATVQSTSQTQESSTKEEELEPYTVTYWVYGSESKDSEKIEEEVNKLIQEKLPNTTVDFVWITTSEYRDKWNKALAAGEKIDIGWSASWVNSITDDVANRVVTPVEDLLLEYGEGIVEAVGGWDVMNLHKSADGVLYFIPCWQGLVGERYGLHMKQEVADLMPEGWMEESQKIAFENNEFTVEDKLAILDRVEDIFEVAVANDLNGNGINITGVQSVMLSGLVKNNFFASVTEDNGVFTVLPWYDNEVYMAYGNKLHEWYEKGYIRSDILSAPNKLDGTQVMWAAAATPDNWIEDQEIKRGWDLDGFLLNENNKFITGFSTGVVIPYTSENPERAMQVLNLIYTEKDIYQLLVYGIAGEHYITNNDGTITRPAADNRTYTGLTNWTIGTCMFSLPESASMINYYQDLKNQEATAEENPLVGFSFSTENIATQYANIRPVRTEYQYCFFQDNWEEAQKEFIEKMYAAGYQDYIDEYKKQLKEYVEANNLGTVAD